jgi:hypothetical protein
LDLYLTLNRDAATGCDAGFEVGEIHDIDQGWPTSTIGRAA